MSQRSASTFIRSKRRRFSSVRYSKKLIALSSRKCSVTDEVSAIKRLGHKVVLVVNDDFTFKITYHRDLPLAEFVLKQRESDPESLATESDEAQVALTPFALPFLPAVAKNLPMNRAYRFGRYHADRMRGFADAVNRGVRGVNSSRAVREMVSGAYPFTETEFSRKYLRRRT
jgi:hypothetical protein